MRARFGNGQVFRVNEGNVGWRMSVRGAGAMAQKEETVKIRVVNPPEDVAITEIRNKIEEHVSLRAGLEEEMFREPRLRGI